MIASSRSSFQGMSWPAALVAAVVVLSLSAAVRADEKYPWQIGLAKAVITPKESMWMAGYAARKSPSEGKLHDLYAKAAAFQDPQGRRLVIVTLDLIGVPRELSLNVLKGVEQKYQLKPHELLLNASHTHCGPELRPNKVYFYGLPEEQGSKIAAYVSNLTDQLIELVGESINDLKPARLAVSLDAATFAKNRRFPTPTGFVNREYDDGPVDHEVPVLQVWRRAGDGGEQLAAVLFGYACHNTTLGILQFCGDYAGFAQIVLEKQLPGTQAMFVMGAGGDQNPYPRREILLAEQHGASLAAAVIRALNKQAMPVAPALHAARADATLRFQPLPPRKELEADLESNNVYRVRKAKYLLDQLDAGKEIELTYPCPVHVARFGDQMILVAIGGELVVDYSHKLKSSINEGPLVWVAGYSNDVFGYLPSKRVLLEGGYEGGGAMLYGALPGPFAEDVEQRVLATVDELLKRTQATKQP